MKTKQIVFTKPNTAELIDAEYSAPGAGEVTVEIAYSAISAGTERANITGDRNVSIGPSCGEAVFPRVSGYSASGIVTETGTGVSVKAGDRVVVYWGRHTANITVSERDHIVKIEDDHIPLAEASLAMIATFPMAAVRKTRLELGESAMVMGLGILGLFAVQLCKAAGGCPVIAVDPITERRSLALKLGADYAFDPAAPDFAGQILAVTHGGVQAAIEVTGRGEGFIQALDCMAKMGRIALLGCTRDPDFTVDYYRKIHGPGISVIGAHTLARPSEESYPGHWTHRDDIAALLRLLSGGRLNFGAMINEIHSPSEATDVYSRLVTNTGFPVGVLFDWSDLK
ncbi:MAG: zinc-dependent alcohol dehydrogenase [Eubacteriales bacterium]